MLVSFCEPSHNYNIILTPEELKELQETGSIVIGRPSITKVPTCHYVDGKRVSESKGHNLIFNDSPGSNPDADRTVQFLVIGVSKEE